jgi:hypothetical protein
MAWEENVSFLDVAARPSPSRAALVSPGARRHAKPTIVIAIFLMGNLHNRPTSLEINWRV